MRPGLAAWILKKWKWECVGEAPVPVKDCIFLEAPHTSLWDFLIGYLYYRSHGGHLKIMIKEEMFRFPIGGLLKKMGGIPINRKNANGTIMAIVHAMHDSEEPFHLAICPEGTRKPVHKWKTGYHTIAKGADIPVYVSFVDWGHKKVGIYGAVELTDNARADTDRIQKLYKDLGVIGKHPAKFLTE